MTAKTQISSHQSRPRLMCRLVRQWSAIISHDKPSHVRACPDCQAYFQRRDDFEQALHDDAVEMSAVNFAASSNLDTKIIRAIREMRPHETQTRSRLPSRSWTVAAVAAAAATAVVAVWLRVDPLSNSAPRVAVTTPADDAAVIIKTVEELSTELVSSMIPAAGAAVAENPLQRELGSVYSDMRSALDFLAMNFLPTAPIESPPGSGRRI